jgi:hypothetical protein
MSESFMTSRLKNAIPLFRIILLVCLASIVPSCDEASSPAESPEPSSTNDVGFEAAITGSYEGKVSGIGVLVFLPDAGFEKQGYFFLADGQGIRPHGVTFVLPRGIAPGKHKLESPSPLDIGTVLSVRVDRDMGNSTLSSEKNTSGVLDLIAFPADENKLSGSDVAGSFEFETEDLGGQKITVKGNFSFKVE